MPNTKGNQESELSLKLLVVMNRALESVEKMVIKDIKSHGLNQTEFAVLELLYNKGEQPIQQIGKKVLLASSSITYVVDKLEEKGHLERKACPTDRRVTHAHITEKGRALMKEIFPKHREAVNDIFANLSISEKETLIEQLKKIGYFAEDLAVKSSN